MTMEIHILQVLGHLLLAGACYGLFWLFYRFIRHPGYRWQQKGNACYKDARVFSFLFGIVLFMWIVFIMNDLITFKL